MTDVTRILQRLESGDPAATSELLPLVYNELRKLASARLALERPDQTLQATALVHEAYLRLVGNQQRDQRWDGRGHFFAAAAKAMRRIVIEGARRRQRLKRGGDMQRVDLDAYEPAMPMPDDRLLELDEALQRLEAEEPLSANLIKLHFFAGMPLAEAARNLGIARSTAYEHWSYGRAWLKTAMVGEAD